MDAEWQFKFAAIQAVVSVLGLLGLLFTVLYARSAWREARVSARAAASALAISERTSVLQFRPYVTISYAKIETTGSPPRRTAVVKYKNTGQTPAIDLRFWVGVEIRRYPYLYDFDDNIDGIRLGLDIVTPGLEQTGRQYIPGFKDDVIELFRSGKMAVYVIGAIDYKDLAGNQYTTRYRFVSMGERFRRGSFGPDERGNHMT